MGVLLFKRLLKRATGLASSLLSAALLLGLVAVIAPQEVAAVAPGMFSALNIDWTGATLPTGALPAFTGDVTSPAGSKVNTLATVNSNVGGCGGANAIPQVTLDAKGRATACAPVTPAIPTTELTGTLQAAQEPAHTGDMTNAAGSLATTVGAVQGKAYKSGASYFAGWAPLWNTTNGDFEPGSPGGTGYFLADSYGTAHNGSTDDTAALQAALNACSSAGGGKVLIGPYQYLVNSANLSIPAQCSLEGLFSPGGSTLTNAYGTVPYALLLNTSYTVSMHRNSGLVGLAVLASNMPLTEPGTIQAAATAVQSFAGTGVTLGPEGSSTSNNGNDITVRDLLIMGFNQCVNATWADRSRGDHIYGDCTNGLLINESNDVSRWTNIHFWPFLVQNNAVGAPLNATITGVVTSGGLCKYTTSAANGFATGNVIMISAVGGVPNCVGVFTITVVDTTHFTANGSTFAGTYTSGGQATLDTAFRNGIAFQIENSVGTQLVDIFSYNYSYGVNPTTGADYIDIVNASIDGTLADNNPASTGYTINGNASGIHIFGGYVSSQASDVVNNTTGPAATTVVGATLGNTGANALYAAAGALQMIGGTILGGSAPNTVAGSATLDMIGVSASNSTNLSGGAVASQLTQIGPATTLNTLLANSALGYATGNGAGGTVTQATSKSTGVTLNKATGQITLNGAALAAGTIVSFTLTDSSIAATDTLVLNHISGGTPGSYSLNAQAGAGSATINVRNNTGGSLSEAIVIQFSVVKGATTMLEPANDKASTVKDAA